jgi:hypothetical protein
MEVMPFLRIALGRGTLSHALRAKLSSVLSLRDALADASQQNLTKLEPFGECYERASNVSAN